MGEVDEWVVAGGGWQVDGSTGLTGSLGSPGGKLTIFHLLRLRLRRFVQDVHIHGSDLLS